MSEIKSTLDIVLERTRSLTMSDEERKALRRKELTGRFKGWIRKCLDGLVPVETAVSELKKGASDDPAARPILVSEILEGLNPEDPEERILDLMEKLLGVPKKPLQELTLQWRESLALEKKKWGEDMKKRLAAEGFSGSALMPNPERDPSWKAYCDQRLAAFRENCRLRLQS